MSDDTRAASKALLLSGAPADDPMARELAKPSPSSPEEVLRAVEAGPAHSLAVTETPFNPHHVYVRTALERGWLKRMPARGRWKERLVVTTTGSHALGSFDSDARSFAEDAREAGRAARVAREASTAADHDARARAHLEQVQREPSKAKGKAFQRERHGGQLRMFNPSKPRRCARPRGEIVELGKLTRLEWKTSGGQLASESWGLRSAPILAYDTAGRLFVVHDASASGQPSSEAARKSYARTHWGKRGRAKLAGGVLCEDGRELGEGTRIQYTTTKGGDGEPVDYVHDWGEGATQPWTPPIVVRHACAQGSRCPTHDGVALVGGSYRVTERGIVG
jgi:hypothetical protein